MIRSSSSTFWNTTFPCTASSTMTAPSTGFLNLHDRRHAREGLFSIAAAPVIARLFLARELGIAHLLELFLRAVAVVGLALGEPLPDDFAVSRVTFALVERPLIGIEAEPLHAVQDHLHGFRRRTLAIGVLDAQDERAAVAARVQPAEERGAHAADVQQSGRARREAGAYGHGAAILAR